MKTYSRRSAEIKFTPWWWEAAPREPHADTPVPAKADVAIVGAGFTGLSAALTLARAGRDVLVLDALAPGFGASTRNGGQVGPGNQIFTVTELVARHGKEHALALIREGDAMLAYIAELIEAEHIDCAFARVGRFRGAGRPAHYERMARNLEALQRFAGLEFHMVPKAEQHSEIGSDWYHGGAVLPRDCAIHPGLFHRGLLERARAAGVRVHGYTPVIGIESGAGSSAVHTPAGTLRARDLIIATNGYTGRGLPRFVRRIVPIGSAIIATAAIDRDLMDRLMPRRRVMGETRRVFNYYRPSPDGRRILFGGRIGAGTQHRGAAFRHLHRELGCVFPALTSIGVTHCWSGYVGYTFDSLPHLGQLDGVYYAMGYCGTGVSRSTYFGHKIALKVLADPAGRTAFDELPFKTHRLYTGNPWMVPFAERGQRLLDWLGR